MTGGSALGAQLSRALDLPLRDYLRALIPAPQTRWNVHRLRLARALEKYLRRHGDPFVDETCDHLLRVPVMQQADHSSLLLDAQTFLNNYLFHVACREAGVPVALNHQCSTVSGIVRRAPVLGPTFLPTRGGLFGVFPFSKKTLKSASFCGLPGPVEMTFDPLAGTTHDVASDLTLGPLVGLRAPDAPTAYRRANDIIWRGLDLDHGVRRVGIDVDVVSECVALHLEDPTSPVSALLFDPAVRDAFLRVKRRLVADPSNLAVNNAAPDFLWIRRGHRLHQVVLTGSGHRAQWTVETDGAPLPVPMEPTAVAAALRAGVLYPDRILTYLVRCLLPGVVAVGGTSQQDYVKLYRRMFVLADAETPFLDRSDLEHIRRPGHSVAGGRPLLEPYGEAMELIRRLGPHTRLDDLDDAYLDRPVGETIGELRCVGHLERAIDR
ncbi:hypothetical protein Val02_47370 [Virgisporangium aliadipatigenens]|uniref:Uncharacterized protein n=1 Tax=Virgisporangium aliadipatigenens TaxID=741659 RepID=A0A8J3YMB6_9ACTN|nr:hypothetical protein [Virgisporangium aliadipatigenens]GIJ47851.1 hypothetical protein Val02_47370 [Virgisporangium aliadipatigenens]